MTQAQAPEPDPLPAWLAALDDVVAAMLARGAKVAAVGCGRGASAILMARAYPRSRFFGFDSDPRSIELARRCAAEAGVGDRVTFDVASATDFPGREYDLVCHFDGLSEAENPSGAARRAREALTADGRIVELRTRTALSNRNPDTFSKETAMHSHEHKTEHKTFSKPDEIREFPNGRAEIVKVGGADVGRLVLKPGWRWSKDVKPLAKTESCEAPHFQYHVSGKLAIKMDDGTELVAGPGDITSLPQGHDAWVVGDEPVVVVDWYGATDYARR